MTKRRCRKVASYGDLVHKITTAEINRVQREGGYSLWAYFVDELSGKVGVIFANDTTFAAYSVDDSPDPKLWQFGLEAIVDLQLTPNPDLLILKAGENEFRASIFSDPLVIMDDEFTDAFTDATAQSWQRFLHKHGVRLAERQNASRLPTVVFGLLGICIAVFLAIAFMG
jgi:hypothetical protein